VAELVRDARRPARTVALTASGTGFDEKESEQCEEEVCRLTVKTCEDFYNGVLKESGNG